MSNTDTDTDTNMNDIELLRRLLIMAPGSKLPSEALPEIVQHVQRRETSLMDLTRTLSLLVMRLGAFLELHQLSDVQISLFPYIHEGQYEQAVIVHGDQLYDWTLDAPTAERAADGG